MSHNEIWGKKMEIILLLLINENRLGFMKLFPNKIIISMRH